MNAPIKESLVLERRTEDGQSSLEAVHASRRGQVNRIDVLC